MFGEMFGTFDQDFSGEKGEAINHIVSECKMLAQQRIQEKI